jgi:hypothetical protein
VADRMLEALRNSEDGLTRTQIYDLLGHGTKAGRINSALGLLLSTGRVTRWMEATDGKAKEIWTAY